MKKSDYNQRISELEAENKRLRVEVLRIPALESENKLLREQIEVLGKKLLEVADKVERMGVRKDSHNSHIPPSSDIGRKTSSLRPSSDRKAGGQPGHKGSTLKMTNTPDNTAPLVPAYCSNCAAELDASKAILQGRRQVIDIPPIEAKVTEYQVFGIVCKCGHHQVESFPPGVDNHVQYGPNIRALAVYHNVYQYVPFKRLQDFFSQVCNLSLSVGTLENMVAGMAHKARPIWEGFRQKLEQSKAVGSDETSARVNGKKQWVWVWQSSIITFLAISVSRGSSVVEYLFPKGFPYSALVSDRWKAHIKTVAKIHQICLAHLLRELIYLIELEKTDWATQFKSQLLDTIQLKQSQKAYPKDHTLCMLAEQKLDELLAQNIPHANATKTISFQKSMNKHRACILPFLYHPDIPFENNASERAIRNLKVKLKVSGQFKTGHEPYCILRSIIDTSIKNGQSVFGAISAINRLSVPPLAAV